MKQILPWALLLLLGCGRADGPDIGFVTGTVKMDGQPLSSVDVYFQPQNGRPSTGLTNEQGVYELWYSIDRKGAMTGAHTVAITTAEVDDTKGDEEVKRKKEAVPSKYNKKSELVAEVKRGTNTIDFDLTSN